MTLIMGQLSDTLNNKWRLLKIALAEIVKNKYFSNKRHKLCLFSNPDTNYQKNIFSIKGISACYALFSNPDINYQKNVFSIKGISACYALFSNPYTSDFERKDNF